MGENIKINIENNQFHGNSSIFRQDIYMQSSEIPYKEFYKELEELNQRLNPTSTLGQAINNLQRAVKNRNENNISNIIKKFSSDFSSSFFASIASTALLNYIQNFL